MTNEFINSYLSTKKVRYENTNYLAFINAVGVPALPPVIHIAGTNGKGSTALYTASALQNSGYKVGLFTSPYFFNVNEMTSINGALISDAFIIDSINKYKDLFDVYLLSSAEILTYISLLYFAQNELDFVVLEVMMGGEKDTTNIVSPLISVITSIGEDHLKELGPTLKEVAKHKAGIIKNGVDVVLGKVSNEVFEVISKVVNQKNASLHFSDNFTVLSNNLQTTFFAVNNTKYTIRSGATYEVKNAVAALKIIELLKNKGYKITEEAISNSFTAATLPGRFNVVKDKPIIIIDGAHNPPAIIELMNGLKTLSQKIHVVFATFKDKDYKKNLDLLALGVKSITLTSFENPRAESNFNENLPFNPDHIEVIKNTLRKIEDDELLLVTGSLHFAGLVKEEFEEHVYE